MESLFRIKNWGKATIISHNQVQINKKHGDNWKKKKKNKSLSKRQAHEVSFQPWEKIWLPSKPSTLEHPRSTLSMVYPQLSGHPSSQLGEHFSPTIRSSNRKIRTAKTTTVMRHRGIIQVLIPLSLLRRIRLHSSSSSSGLPWRNTCHRTFLR